LYRRGLPDLLLANKRVIDFAPTSDTRKARAVPPGSADGRAWPVALIVLLIACLLFHATVVQTHVHFIGPSRLAAAASGAQSVRAAPAGGEGTDECPLCQEMAMAGAYLLPASIVLPVPPALPVWVDAVALHEFGLRSRAHGWRSRAPPQ